MEDEEGYTVLNLKPRGDRSAVPPPARIQGTQRPQRCCLVLWGGWAGSAVLLVAVIALGMWVSQLVSEKGQTLAAPESRDPSRGDCNASLEHVRSKLCLPAQPSPTGGSGCKLCPPNWQLQGDKCYWVSREPNTWKKSCSDCVGRGSQLLLIQDQEELEALQKLTQASAKLWVGLSHPSLEKGWTWLNGSRLDQTRLRVLGTAEMNRCGMVNGNQINSESCGSAYQWICQRDAVLL